MDKYSRRKNQPVVQTNFGDIEGQIETFNDAEAMAFYSIRYARPPIGLLRFRKPEPMDEITIKTHGLQSNEKVACVQPEKNFLIGDDLNISEDCLHLNIWVPVAKLSEENVMQDDLLPVMIWIHGGSFHIGSGNQDEFNGIVLSTVGKVIVVTLNYRLGFFGFLYAGIETASGNMGLYDQAAALKWVKENIKLFGGDSDEITMVGHSAGALSVGILTVSPITRNLFKRAIIQSGSPYSPIRPEPKAEIFKKSLVFSRALNCSNLDAQEFTESTVKCLRDLDYKIIDDYGRNEALHSQILANPMFGDDFLPANARELMKTSENINKNLEVLLGVTRDEGFFFVADFLPHLVDSSGPPETTKKKAYADVKTILEGRPVDPVNASHYYFRHMPNKGDSRKVLTTITDLYGDLYFHCPVYYLGNRYKELLGQQNVYSYMLSKASARPFLPICKKWKRVCHGDEIVLIFGVPLRQPQQFDDSDLALSKHIVHLWTNFVKTG